MRRPRDHHGVDDATFTPDDGIPEMLADLRGAVAARVREDAHGELLLRRRLGRLNHIELAALVYSCVNGDLTALARRHSEDAALEGGVLREDVAAGLESDLARELLQTVPEGSFAVADFTHRPRELIAAAVELLSVLCVMIARYDGNAPADRARWVCMGTGLAR